MLSFTLEEEIIIIIIGLSCSSDILCAGSLALQHHHAEGKQTIPILQMGDLRLREVKCLDQCHTAFPQS